MTITPEEVAKLAAAATPGPWTAIADETAAQVKGFPKIEADDYEVVGLEGMYGDYETDWANAAFIAAAHDMAALIVEQDRLLKLADAMVAAALTEAAEVAAHEADYVPHKAEDFRKAIRALITEGAQTALTKMLAEAKAGGMREAVIAVRSKRGDPDNDNGLDLAEEAILAAADAIQKEGGA